MSQIKITKFGSMLPTRNWPDSTKQNCRFLTKFGRACASWVELIPEFAEFAPNRPKSPKLGRNIPRLGQHRPNKPMSSRMSIDARKLSFRAPTNSNVYSPQFESAPSRGATMQIQPGGEPPNRLRRQMWAVSSDALGHSPMELEPTHATSCSNPSDSPFARSTPARIWWDHGKNMVNIGPKKSAQTWFKTGRTGPKLAPVVCGIGPTLAELGPKLDRHAVQGCPNRPKVRSIRIWSKSVRTRPSWSKSAKI